MKRTFLAALILLVLAAGVYLGVVRPALAPSKDLELGEQALLTPDVVVLAHANVREALFLERWYIGSPIFAREDTPPPAGDDRRSLVDEVRAAGVDPRRDIDEVLYALYPTDGEALRQAIVLLGRFDPAAIGDRLGRRSSAVHRDVEGRASYEIERSDPDTCGSATRWVVTAGPRWILLADPASHPSVVARLTGEPLTDPGALAWWRPLARDDVLAIGVRDPGALGSALTQPFLQAQAHAITVKAASVRRAYIGLGINVVPPRGRLRLVVDGPAAKDIERLQQEVSESQSRWTETMPTVAALYRSLRVRAAGDRSTIEFRVDPTLATNLQQVANEAIGALFGGLGVQMTGAAGASPSERLEEHPVTFQQAVAPGALPAYDPKAMFADAVDRTEGPFGLRIEAVRLGSDQDVGLELVVDGFAGDIPNMTGDSERARLFVDSVKSTSGRELLRPEPCGKERNGVPAPFKASTPGRLKAEKTVRLLRDAEADDIGSVSGHVELRLPTRTEAVTLPHPGPASTLRRDGTTVAVPKVDGGDVSYQITGAKDRVLLLRGLNDRGQPLAQMSAFSSDFLFGEGMAGGKNFAGKVDRLEVVFATEERTLAFPFTLIDAALKGAAGPVFPDTIPPFRPYSYATLGSERWKPLVPRAPDAYRALARLDPFEVSLDGAQAFYLMKLDLTVRSPELPDLRGAFSPGRLDLKRIELKDGSALEPPAKDPAAKPSMFGSSWSPAVRFGSAPKDGALATQLWIMVDTKAKPEDLRRLEGTLTVRFPKSIDTLRMSDLTVGRRVDAGGMTVTVSERRRGKVTFQTDRGGERIVYIRLLNTDGQAVSYSPTVTEGENGAWSFDLSSLSACSAAELLVARELDARAYPFILDVR